MKPVQIIALVFALLIIVNIAFAQSGLITVYDNGLVDWYRNTIITQGIGQFNPDLTPSQFRLSAVREARMIAEKNLLNILLNLNFTCDKSVRNVVSLSVETANRVEEMVKDYRIVGKPKLMPDSTVAIEVEFNLSSQLLDELLELTDMPDIDTIDDDVLALTHTLPIQPVYLDCRGLEMVPTIAPIISSESGTIVYTPRMAENELLDSNQIIKYISYSRTLEDDPDFAFGSDNLIKVKKIDKCDIIIDEIEYNDLISLSNRLNALKYGQVLILVD